MKTLSEIHANIDKTAPCWRWQRAHTTDGRPEVWYSNRPRYVYRLLYELEIGPIPDGLTLDHVVCSNGWCCNPAHCEPVTNSENVRRQLAARYQGRTACPAGHPYAEFRRMDSRGKPWCAACNSEKAKARYQARRDPSKPRTHCLRGHAYAEHGEQKGDKWTCMMCAEYYRARRAAKQQQ